MKTDFDPAKDTINRRRRGIPLAAFIELDWSRVKIVNDDYQDYGEARYVATPRHRRGG